MRAVGVAAALLAAARPSVGAPQKTAPGTIDFARDVHAILAGHCTVCHNQDKRSGGLSLGTYDDVLAGGRSGAAVKPGDSAASLMMKRIRGEIAPQMPFGGDPLSSREMAVLAAWIDEGARSTPSSVPAKTRWEPPMTLSAPEVPAQTWSRWSDPIDRFTSRYLARHGAPEPKVVDDAVFARRAYLDVWGLLPDTRQIHEFLVDKDPAKRAKLVASLMDQPAMYAENWISYWNDLLRNDEGVAYYSETAQRKSITPWLLRALETNEPYNRMVKELLNPMTATDPDGFLIGVNWRGTVSASQTPAMQASQNAAQIFLGINFKCNSCHDSFISKWKLKDAYGLAAYFSTEEKLQLYRCDVAQEGQFSTARFMYPELDRASPSGSIADRRATLAEIFTDPRNGRVPRTLVNRIWERLMGRGIVENVDDMDGEPWSPELLDWMASDFVRNGYDIKRLIAAIMSSRTYQLPSLPQVSATPGEYTFRGPELRRLTAEQFADAVASVTGDWHVSNSAMPNFSGNSGAGRGGPPGGAIAAFSGEPVDTEANYALNNPARSANPAPAAAGRGGTPRPSPPAPPPVPGGYYAREWRIAGSSLTRALGRPIRDQVYSTRDAASTTIQAVELVNGEPLNHWLWRGAQRMLGQLPPEPASLFSRQVTAGRSAGPEFSVDISRSQKLYFIVEDNLSSAPDKAAPIWLNAVLTGPQGTRPLASLLPMDPAGLRQDTSPVIPQQSTSPAAGAVRVKFPSALAYDIAGGGFTRLEGVPTFESVELGQGEAVSGRFFIFDQQPSMDRLAPPHPETPLPPESALKTIPETVDRVYWWLLSRAPSSAERQVAESALRDPSRPGHPSPAGLADLLWSVMMTPEFQFIR